MGIRNNLYVLSLATLLPWILVACGPSDSTKGEAVQSMPPPVVSVITVKAGNQPVAMEYVGQTAGSRSVEVRARVGGILEKRLFDEGSAVQAGKALFQIDTATFKNQLNLAEAAVAVAQAKLHQTQRDVQRLEPLALAKAISQKEYDDSQTAYESAQASLKLAQAQAQDAKLKLSYATVTAPITGTTAVAALSEGSLIAAGESLLTTIIQTDPIYVNFSVAESDWLRMKSQIQQGRLQLPASEKSSKNMNTGAGLAVKLRLADGSTYPVDGMLNFSGESINAQTGSFDMRAQVSNTQGYLKPGQFVRVQLVGAVQPDALVVPQRAVIDSPIGKMVFVVTPDNTLEPRPVELGNWVNGQWIVNKGIRDGDRVQVDGFVKAHDPGMKVTPKPYDPQQTSVQPANDSLVKGKSATQPASTGASPR